MAKVKNPYPEIQISSKDMLNMLSERTGLSKKTLIQKALKDLCDKQLEADLKIIAKIKVNDLPTEDEWLKIQTWPKF